MVAPKKRPLKHNAESVYLRDEQAKRLNALAERTGLSKAEILRRSFDFFDSAYGSLDAIMLPRPHGGERKAA